MFSIDDTTVLMTPRQDGFAWDDLHRRQAAIYFKNALGLDASAQAISRVLPDTVTRWGKYRVLGDKEIVRSVYRAAKIRKERSRDSSFVRVSYISSYSIAQIHRI